MSNWLTVRLTERRSSARSAPISYTPPVNPPPPSTSAVLDWRRRRGVPPRRRSFAGLSSLTTLPILHPSVRMRTSVRFANRSAAAALARLVRAGPEAAVDARRSRAWPDGVAPVIADGAEAIRAVGVVDPGVSHANLDRCTTRQPLA